MSLSILARPSAQMAFKSAPAVQIGFRVGANCGCGSFKEACVCLLSTHLHGTLRARFSGDISPTPTASSHSGAAFKSHFSLPGTLGEMGPRSVAVGQRFEVIFWGREANEMKSMNIASKKFRRTLRMCLKPTLQY
jgi:hypothetical protein